MMHGQTNIKSTAEIHLRFQLYVPLYHAVVYNAMDDCINATPRPLNPRERYLVPMVQEDGKTSGPV